MTIRLFILVYEDYGIATIKEGDSPTEYETIRDAMKEGRPPHSKPVATYEKTLTFVIIP